MKRRRHKVRCPLFVLDIDPGGAYVASAGTDNRIQVWDLAKQQRVTEVEVQATPTAIAFMKGQLLAVGSTEGVLGVVEVKADKLR
jgi:hypothetical protein